jgi:hypothetical protein
LSAATEADGVFARLGDKGRSPMAETWYELTTAWSPASTPIVKRQVTSETACFVFHTNGRKSKKYDLLMGPVWFKTFAEAKDELVGRSVRRTKALESSLASEKRNLDSILELSEELCSKSS